ncbi:MAG: hypothetical protein ACK5KR_08345 [Breznakia sp.]
MKKLIMMMALSSLLVVGCNRSDQKENEQMQSYLNMKEKLLNNGGNPSYNIPFSYAINVEEVDGHYVYTLTIDKAQVIMNKFQAMSLIPTATNSEDIEPCIGVFEELSYSFVPNQEDKENGYISGFSLGGKSNEASFDVYALIAWYKEDNSTLQNTFVTFRIEDGVEVVENE